MRIPIEFMGDLAAAGEAVRILVINPYPALGLRRKDPLTPKPVERQGPSTRLTNAAAPEVSPYIQGVAFSANGSARLADAPE